MPKHKIALAAIPEELTHLIMRRAALLPVSPSWDEETSLKRRAEDHIHWVVFLTPFFKEDIPQWQNLQARWRHFPSSQKAAGQMTELWRLAHSRTDTTVTKREGAQGGPGDGTRKRVPIGPSDPARPPWAPPPPELSQHLCWVCGSSWHLFFSRFSHWIDPVPARDHRNQRIPEIGPVPAPPSQSQGSGRAPGLQSASVTFPFFLWDCEWTRPGPRFAHLEPEVPTRSPQHTRPFTSKNDYVTLMIWLDSDN